jgi:3-hydroxyisobutyrate dehydrogenase
LGRIGLPMASRLVQGDHGLVVWDISPDAVRAAVRLGAEAAVGAADVARRADVCFLCLPGESAIEAVVFGPGGIVEAASHDLIVVDHSTIDPDRCREFAGRAIQRSGIAWVDMPVSGGVDAAAAGNLIAWAGGAVEDVAAVVPIASKYIARISRMGAVGQGQLAKSCNQMIVGATIALWSEMLRYAAEVGLDPAEMVETLEGGAADSPVSRRFAAALAKGEMPEKSIRNMRKDLAVVINQSAGTAFSPKMTVAALEEFEKFIESAS